MTDILDDLRAYLAGDNSVIFSQRRINEMIAAVDGLRAKLNDTREISSLRAMEAADMRAVGNALRAELAAANEAAEDAGGAIFAISTENGKLRAELAAARQDHQRDIDQMRQDWQADTNRLRAELAATKSKADRYEAAFNEHGGRYWEARWRDADAELAAARELREQYQRERAELADKLNGTPCAEIRWQQERDELLEVLRTGVAVLGDTTKHLGLQLGQDRAAELIARIDAALTKGDK